MRASVANAILKIFIWATGFVSSLTHAQSIDILWYTYAHSHSYYIETIRKIGDAAHTLQKSSKLKWNITFFGPDSATPDFSKYNVLVIQSGEAFHTAQYSPFLDLTDPKKPHIPPDYRGILQNKAAIEMARGDRTFISGSDADVHAINGDTGNAPADPNGFKRHVTCHPSITGSSCWDGALGHLVNAVNWAGSGSKLGIVSLVAAEFPGSHWWLDPRSFLRKELTGFVTTWGNGKKRENDPVIPATAKNYPLNAGLTSKGLGNWRSSFHAGFSHSLPGYAPIVDSTLYPLTAVAVASITFAAAGARGPALAPSSTVPALKRN
jgi:hypothetical protein